MRSTVRGESGRPCGRPALAATAQSVDVHHTDERRWYTGAVWEAMPPSRYFLSPNSVR